MTSRLAVLLSALLSSWPPARALVRRRRERARCGHPQPPPRRGGTLGRGGGAHDLRRRVPEGRARGGQGGLRDGEPGHDRDPLDGLVVRPRDPDRAGCSGRRLPVGRHDEPEEARRCRSRRWRRRHLRRQRADDHRADRQPGRDRDAGRPREGRRQGHRRRRESRSRSTQRNWSTTWPRRPATRPTSRPGTPPTSRPRKTT